MKKAEMSLAQSNSQLTLTVLCFALMFLLSVVLVTTMPDFLHTQTRRYDFFFMQEIIWSIAVLFWIGPLVCLTGGIAFVKSQEWAKQLLESYTSILLYAQCVFVGAVNIFMLGLPWFVQGVFSGIFLLCLIMKILLWETLGVMTSEERVVSQERKRKRLLRLCIGMIVAILVGFLQVRAEYDSHQSNSFFGHF